MSKKESSKAHIRETLPELHASVLDIVGVFNSPERDAANLEDAGLTLERALFPLLVLIGKYGPIGVVDVATRVGRDYTTVSRQVARLEQLGLVKRRSPSADGFEYAVDGRDGADRGDVRELDGEHAAVECKAGGPRGEDYRGGGGV
jgi:hypothetical protein